MADWSEMLQCFMPCDPRARCGDFHSVASTTTTSKSVRFSMEQQLEEEEAEAAAAEIYMDYRYE